jgi:hypothetical protein
MVMACSAVSAQAVELQHHAVSAAIRTICIASGDRATTENDQGPRMSADEGSALETAWATAVRSTGCRGGEALQH